MYKQGVLLTLAVAIVGCASTEPMTPEQQQQLISEYNQQKTFEISCVAGCTVAYKDPRDQLNLPKYTNGWDVLNTTVQTVGSVITSAVPYAAIGIVATEGIKNSGGNTSSSYNTDSNEANQATETTTTETSTTTYDSSYNTESSTEEP